MKALILAGVASVALIGAAAAQDNYLRSQQTGIDNDIDAVQSGSNNAAGIRNSTTNNLRQTGDGNDLKITQSGDNNTIGGTRPFLIFNLSASRQTGNNNSLEINQGGSNNTTKYIQNGNNNGRQTAGVTTGTSGAPALGRTYTAPSGQWNYIEQSGSNTAGTASTVDILQNVPLTTGGAGNGVIARQSAASSTITLTQQAGTASNLASFEQSGSNNTASVSQAATGANRNLADIRQSDSNSRASATQTGSGLDLFVTQTGGNNRSTTSQTLSADSYIQVSQTHDAGGANNQVNATQLLTNLSSLLVTQTGYGQTATSVQQGNFITASVEQTGFGNTYSGLQSGSNNAATVTQANNGNLANVLQTGTNSAVTIRQAR